MNVAAKVRQHKEDHPDLYCSAPRCLWRTMTQGIPTPCPKHPAKPAVFRDDTATTPEGSER